MKLKNVLLSVISLVVAVSGIIFIFRKNNQVSPVSSFDVCVAAGNPIMESYPRKCRYKGITYTEVLMEKSSMTESEAKVIAESSCIKGGEALGAGSFNPNSKTWWFDANLNSTHDGCNPACVVSEDTKIAEINWRCTGLRN